MGQPEMLTGSAERARKMRAPPGAYPSKLEGTREAGRGSRRPTRTLSKQGTTPCLQSESRAGGDLGCRGREQDVSTDLVVRAGRRRFAIRAGDSATHIPTACCSENAVC